MSTITWQEKATAKRESLLGLIPAEWRLPSPLPPPSELPNVTGPEIRKYLSPAEIEITESSAVDIVRKTCSGEWKSEDVARAFCHRAAVAHQMISCLHEILFESALARARELDLYLATHEKPLGPLHGLPVSLKDSIHVAGADTSMGIVGWLDTFEGLPHTATSKSQSSTIVHTLLSLGAIPYVKTSVPQASFAGETVNHIIGHTPNPANRSLVVGGSSGGEGGLLALRASPLGLGTDIGGSIREPAAFNGLVGLKPSRGRLPYQGIASIADGAPGVGFVVGPMGHSVQDLGFFMMALLAAEPWRVDPGVVELPWRDQVFEETRRRFAGKNEKEKMAFGVLLSDGVVNPQPPVSRALREVVKAVEALGHSVIEWNPPSHAEALKIWARLQPPLHQPRTQLTTPSKQRDTVTVDGGSTFHTSISLANEPPTPTIFGKTPQPPVPATEVMQRSIALRTYRRKYLEYWESTAELTGTGRPVDALIVPVHQGCATLPGRVRYMGYTCAVNVLDYSACAIPVTRVRKDVDVYSVGEKGYEGLSHLDKLVHEDYDAELLDGAPVGVQIVGRRLQEESVLALAEEITRELGKGEQARL
ncbi:amidase [Aspergillus pseudoustus]|uniref:amidase n=1 Tax=Aspergillus pseudoustus TaxID=1810923 RepID=A0ABR4IYY6_9EURO